MWGDNTKQNATGGEIAECLCKQVMRRKPGRPSLRYSAKRGEYLMFCPTCKIHTFASSNRQSVIAEWNGMNRPGDPYIAELWEEKFYNQQTTPVPPSGAETTCVSTVTQ